MGPDLVGNKFGSQEHLTTGRPVGLPLGESGGVDHQKPGTEQGSAVWGMGCIAYAWGVGWEWWCCSRRDLGEGGGGREGDVCALLLCCESAYERKELAFVSGHPREGNAFCNRFSQVRTLCPHFLSPAEPRDQTLVSSSV